MKGWLAVVMCLMMSFLCSSSWGQIFSEVDTMMTASASGYPGDTVAIPVGIVNTFPVGGYQCRLAFDPYAFVADTVILSSRSDTFDVFGNDRTDPGAVSFFATSMDPMGNFMDSGRGEVAVVMMRISPYAIPGTYTLNFEDSDRFLHENALSNTRGDTLTIPIFSNSQIEVLPTVGIGDDQKFPRTFELTQNYPNPFNAGTGISFSLDNPQNVRLTVFDVLGKKVRVLYDGPADAGYTSLVWDGRDEKGISKSSGAYFYKFECSGGKSLTRKMTLLK